MSRQESPHPYMRASNDRSRESPRVSRDSRGASREGSTDRNRNYGPNRDYQEGRNKRNESPVDVKENPQTRTLFVRNVNYDVSEKNLKDLVEKYGDVKRFFNLIDKRGMAFITFYDLRAAENAKKDLQGMQMKGRPIDVHYALPKDEDHDDNKNTGTLFVTLKNVPTDPSNMEIQHFFEAWGPIREVRDCRNSSNQKFVEFFDLRDSEKAFAETNGSDFLGGTLDIRFAFVHSRKDGSQRATPKEDTDTYQNGHGYGQKSSDTLNDERAIAFSNRGTGRHLPSLSIEAEAALLQQYTQQLSQIPLSGNPYGLPIPTALPLHPTIPTVHGLHGTLPMGIPTVLPTVPTGMYASSLAAAPALAALRGIPTIPQIPAVPSILPYGIAPTIPNIPMVPTIPTMNPYSPYIPPIPTIPTIPNVPMIPNIPNIPMIPTIPTIHGLHGIPAVPAVPGTSPAQAQQLVKLLLEKQAQELAQKKR